MTTVELELEIAAPRTRVFDLARSVDLHVDSTAGTAERAVAGVTTGLMEQGDEVTWSARHFGIRQRLTSRITSYDRPSHFRDSMVRGAFARFDHDHYFEECVGGCRAREVFDFTSPLGPLGRLRGSPHSRALHEEVPSPQSAGCETGRRVRRVGEVPA